ncbi:class Ib ribonucleoside-diphosphate reductase assembly flavoprotein NrdI [Morganella morganii]|uniref:class Ib ribonucleoside-diphosphate reductase assembly flavoprotein NrdI n=1 Tax=Morganella morganii TaxID=582 RepID=UPI003BA3678E
MTTQALIYFSTRSETCHRFTEKLGIPATRLPEDGDLTATQPFVLLVPTYGGGHHSGAVPRPVIRFLNCPENRALLRGVIAAGNTNFGRAYAIAGDIIAAKCQVPFLYRFELLGTQADVDNVRRGLHQFWQQQAAETAC